MSTTLRDKLIQKGWVTNFNADTLVRLIEEHYAALAEPQPTVEGEVAELVAILGDVAMVASAEGRHELCAQLMTAADLLERLSPDHFVEVPKMVQPIPVSERLPVAGDCDELGRVWWWYPETAGTLGYWQWEADAMERQEDEQPSHWLPHHALPLPSGEVNND
jgi:hypothetical protein